MLTFLDLPSRRRRALLIALLPQRQEHNAQCLRAGACALASCAIASSCMFAIFDRDRRRRCSSPSSARWIDDAERRLRRAVLPRRRRPER